MCLFENGADRWCFDSSSKILTGGWEFAQDVETNEDYVF